MSLSLAAFQIRKRLPRRSSILLFDAACLLGWTTVPAIAELAEVSLRRARLELAELVSRGWLSLERDSREQGRIRYRARVGVIGDDHSAVIVDDHSVIGDDHSRRRPPGPPLLEGRGRAITRGERDPDPYLSRDLDHTRPSVLGGPGGTDGRTEGQNEQPADLRNALLAWVEERHAVSPRLSTPGLMRLLNEGASELELRAYLTDAERGSHPCFDGLQHAQFRFGAICTPERFAKWRASRARARAPVPVEPPPAPRRPVSAVSAREIEDFVRNKLRR